MSDFKDKTLLITGGTGSFGNTVLKHFLTSDIGEIRIFSRDEKKQDELKMTLAKLLQITDSRYQCVITIERSYIGSAKE